MSPVAFLGGGGHARSLLEALRRLGIEVVGLADPDPSRAAMLGLVWLGADLPADFPVSTELVNGLGGVRDTRLRRAVFERARQRGFRFATILHPAAYVADNVQLGEGTQVLAGAVIGSGARLSLNCIINTRAAVDHDCLIGDHAHIAPGAVLSGSVTVGEGAHVGTGATVIQGIVLGRDCLIGAGAAVIRDVPDGATALGVPARIRDYTKS